MAYSLDAITRTANDMTDLHELKGNEEQCKALAEAVSLRRMVIMRMAGMNVHIDNYLSEEDERLVWWQQQLKSKGLD